MAFSYIMLVLLVALISVGFMLVFLDGYVVSRERESLERNAAKAEGAALIVATFVKNVAGFSADGKTADNECGNGWGYYDLGLASEHICLAAKDLGLDTLIMGLRDGEKIRKFLSVPETEQVVAVIAVGHGTSQPAKPPRKNTDEVLKFF